MSEQEKSAAQQRIDNAVYGTPKIKPDEQRKYLGTFRERVCLTISVQELQEQDWTKALTAELDRGIGNLVFINGNLLTTKFIHTFKPLLKIMLNLH